MTAITPHPEKRILLVDDDREHLEMMQRCLERIGLRFVATNSGENALELLQKETFSIVISDIQMPALDGVELLKFIKNDTPEIDVILVTGYSDQYSLTDVIKAGATDYLEKPFTKDTLESKLRRIFREREEISRREATEKKLRSITEQLQQAHGDLEQKISQRTKELQDAQSELLTLFKSVPDGIISVDRSMEVIHANNQCMADLNFLVGQKFGLGDNKFQQECHHVLSQTLKKKLSFVDYQVEFHAIERGHVAFLLSSAVISNKGGNIKGALLIIHDISKVVALENQIKERRQFRKIVGESSKMQDIYHLIRQIASVDTTVLITGESGVGKELIIETLHAQGDRAKKPLVKVNCSALPENLLESELFGHVKGAFTGATRSRMGRVQLAEGGILFLDEIGDISLRLQLKLLRFLEQKEYEVVGESTTKIANVRIYAATNANLKMKVQNGTFREDLYYRLKVMLINVPSLKERQEDIPLLINSFISLFNHKFGKQVTEISDEALDACMNHNWSGNIRELKHAFEHAFLLCRGAILKKKHFPRDIQPNREKNSNVRQPARMLTRESLLQALNKTRWHRSDAAKLLKVSRTTLYTKIKEFGLSD